MSLRTDTMRIFLVFCFLVSVTFTQAQTTAIDALKLASTDQERLIAHLDLAEEMRVNLGECATKEDVMTLIGDWPFGAASAGSDKDWAIILTWNVESVAREQTYGGFVIFNNDKSDLGWGWVELEHSKKDDIIDDERSYKPSSWTGALYYSMILKYDDKTPVYTMLGWDGANGLVTRKVIETMTINNGRLRIGVPCIERENGLKKRHVLEYGDIIQVTLKYEEKEDRIILDRLAPNDPSLKGQTAFYGPTLEYDQFTWDGEKWTMNSFVEVKNEGKRKNRKPYNDPRPKNQRRK